MPIINFKKRVRRICKAIEESQDVNQANKQLFKDYHRHLMLQDHSPAHLQKVLSHLKVIIEKFDFELRDASKEQIEEIVAWINGRDIAEATKKQYKVVLKMLFKWLNDGEYPKQVKWIKTSQHRRNNKLPKDMLTEEDISKMLDVASNPRDRALISLLWETGARIGELYDVEIGDFEDHEHGLKIVINGKTGYRRLPLISSVPEVRAWINSHPKREEKDAPIWVNIGTTNNGQKSEYRTLLKALKSTAKKAGLEKTVNPYHFRHSRATYLANRFTEAQMNEWFGWVQGSNQPQRYVHLSGRDMDRSYAKKHGIEDEETNEVSTLAPKDCPRCGNSVPPDAKFCYKCGMALSLDATLEIEEKEKEISSEFTYKMKENPEYLEKFEKALELANLIEKNEDIMELVKKQKTD